MHVTAAWRDPLKLLPAFAEMESGCLLYSGLIGEGFGRYSLAALWPNETVRGNGWEALDAKEHWFGYLGYGLKNALETLAEDAPSARFPLPDLWLSRYHLIARFDHFEKTLTLTATDQTYIDRFNALPNQPAPALPKTALTKNLHSNMQKSEYLDKAQRVLQAIRDGEVYQANLTRKFFGDWAEPVSAASVFNALCRVSPAPYSAYLKCGDAHILSSSPELFLDIAADGKVTTQPIKGSAPRARDLAEDKAIREQLANSEKNRAENLMIVDLMRNDLSRSCLPGSIAVERLHEITSYLTVHHMSSTITGQKATGKAAMDVVKGCFPPGSMTGAPKIQAMQLCSALERDARGVYSGAIGHFAPDGSAQLSVVIRTLLMDDKGFEFQVGGGIVSDSTPEGEWQETLIKARGLCAALHLDEAVLAAL